MIRAQTVMAGAALALLLGALAYRAVTYVNLPGRPEAARWVLQDFRDAVYYPTVAFFDGRNPYDQTAQAREYPVGQPFPLYLPLTFLLHAPFALFSHADAGAAYFVVTIALSMALAALAINGAGVALTAATVLWLTTALLVTRPGQMNLLLGQVTAQVAIGAYVALRWARVRPLRAGLGLTLSVLKPTSGVLLAVLMLFGRGDVAAVLTGAAIALVLCLVTLVPLLHASGGVGAFAASLGSSAAAFSAERASNAWTTFTRVDATALLARVLGHAPGGWVELALGLTVVCAAVVGLRRLRDDRSAPSAQLGIGLVCLTVLVAAYHQTYDTLLLAQPAVSLVMGRWGRAMVAPPALRWSVLALIAVPALNYLATNTVVTRLSVGSPAWLAITAANPAALLAAWAVHLGLAWRTPCADPSPHYRTRRASRDHIVAADIPALLHCPRQQVDAASPQLLCGIS